MRARRPFLYLVPGLLLWYLLQKSGILGTIAGVLVAWPIPADSRIHETDFPTGKSILDRFDAARSKQSTPILNQELETLPQPVGMGILLGLVVGKPLGSSPRLGR